MSPISLSLALAAMMSAVGAAHAQAPQVLLQQYGCYSCHADDEAKTGPAYVATTTAATCRLLELSPLR